MSAWRIGTAGSWQLWLAPWLKASLRQAKANCELQQNEYISRPSQGNQDAVAVGSNKCYRVAGPTSGGVLGCNPSTQGCPPSKIRPNTLPDWRQHTNPWQLLTCVLGHPVCC